MEPLTGSNFPVWKSQLMIILSFSDIDYVLWVDEPKAPVARAEGYEALRVEYLVNTEKWEQSNRLSRQNHEDLYF